MFNVLNDEFVVGHIRLVPAHLITATPGLPLLCFRLMQCLKINISQVV